MPGAVSAILWAQWRVLRNFYARTRGGVLLAAFTSLLWYGGWAAASVLAALLFASAGTDGLLRALPGILLLVFLYWQAIPILMMATGVALDLRRLLAYPIPPGQLFAIEVLLRLSTSAEMVFVTLGIFAGLSLNPAVPFPAPAALLLFVAGNLLLSAGIRDLIARLLSRRRVREIVFLLLVLAAALPQLLLLPGIATAENKERLDRLLYGAPLPFLPWNAAGLLATGQFSWTALGSLAAAVVLAGVFARRQFARSLAFDTQAAAASSAAPASGLAELLFRLPGHLFPDPLAALIEKEIRFLSRASRFRLVFLMGFTFGFLIWFPMAARGPGGVSANFLAFVSVYSLLLLGDVCFWNAFGFDRSAAQNYFVLPLPLPAVFFAKNITAFVAIVLEISAITAVCALLRLPVSAASIAEAFAVTLVAGVLLIGIGNYTSVTMPRAVNPAQAFRNAAAGKMQFLLLLLYPLAAVPILLAYGARFALESDAAFYGALAVDLLIALIVYRVALDAACAAAAARREEMLDALSRNEGPIAA
jgi:ABC-2 type transport system permease protein